MFTAAVVIPDWLALINATGLALTVTVGLWTFIKKSKRDGTEAVVANMQAEGELPSKDLWNNALNDLNDIKNQFGKIEFQVVELSAQLNNGIKARLDDIVEDQRAATDHRQQMDAKLNELIGMFKEHFKQTDR